MTKTNRTLTPPDLRKLLVAVETLAIRPAQADEQVLAEALAYFKLLVEERTQGLMVVEYLDGGGVDVMGVNLELTEVSEAEMYALANFLKRVNQTGFKQYAESDEEARLMARSVASLQLAIDRAGYEVW